MIRQATPADEGLVLKLARAAPAAGPRFEVDWRLLAENPAMPYRFYIAGNTAVLEDFGRGASLCGPVADSEELLAFLDHMGKDFVVSDGWRPPGWRSRALTVMEKAALPKGRCAPGGAPQDEQPAPAAKREDEAGQQAAAIAGETRKAGPAGPEETGPQLPAPPRPTAPGPLPEGFDPAPPMAEFFALMESTEPIPGPIREGMWFDLCARRNHGFFDLCGIRADGRLASAAAVFNLTGAEAYISGVETLPEYQGRGYASALVAHLAAKYAGRRVSLMCEPPLIPFYERLGFAQSPARYIDARRPGREDAEANDREADQKQAEKHP